MTHDVPLRKSGNRVPQFRPQKPSCDGWRWSPLSAQECKLVTSLTFQLGGLVVGCCRLSVLFDPSMFQKRANGSNCFAR
ncbi:uncharacterized protein B0H64DRAFT_477865 [Chaetomium fimeti]|uniref:Uncharacterized protein n=1 Tax=Chaetomium fimeti TaxID=1854472 RepID=A0AAE0HA52_9PEZI|nr:hypothetical protein B0H64DRAFT_477865 [Chaetomium fimeti]